jgi:hypothetical protein
VPIHVEAEVDLTSEPGRQDAWLGSAGRTAKVHETVEERLRDLFAISLKDGAPNPRVDFGFYLRGASGAAGEVAWSDVVSAMCSTPGVRKVAQVTLNGAQQDIPLAAYEFPTLGDVVLHQRRRDR